MNAKIVVSLLLIISSCSSNVDFKYAVNDSVVVSNSERNEISLITYNTQTVFGKEDSKLNGLSDYLNNQSYDFITLQEVFDEDDRESLVKNVINSKYKASIPRVDYASFPSSLCQDAGLFSSSKYPLEDLSNIDFGENTERTNGAIHQMLFKEFSISFDFLSNKSVLGTLHKINDSTKLFLFTTHLQALSSRRHKTNQLKQIKAFIDNAVYTIFENGVVTNPQNLIVLLTGDFNYNAYSKSDFEILHKYLGRPRDLYKEFNPVIQEYTLIIKFLGLFRRVDYIFAYDYIGKIPLRKVRVKSINVTDVVDKDNESVSDHLALKATLIIE
ncbi:MAG: hypothetical protein KAI45_03145 [Melioribacteraceae bacterium]|nr:hypothetical protein [Melioribacteraceae bacterium]